MEPPRTCYGSDLYSSSKNMWQKWGGGCRFLEQFEICVEDMQLPDEEKVTFSLHCLSNWQKEIFRTFNGCFTSGWRSFKAAIKEGAFEEFGYTRQSLTIQFIQNSLASPILSDSALKAYRWKSQAVVQKLVDTKEISEDEKDYYFWFGFLRCGAQFRVAVGYHASRTSL